MRERLVERADESPGYGGLWRRTIEQRPPGMPVGEAVRFVLWHRTFHGAGVPGLPALVGLARAAAKKARALRAAVSAARDVR